MGVPPRLAERTGAHPTVRYQRLNLLAAPRVVPELAEVEKDARLVTYDLGVVARRDRHHVARPALTLAAVVHEHPHAAGDAVAEVRDLAGLRARDRLHV